MGVCWVLRDQMDSQGSGEIIEVMCVHGNQAVSQGSVGMGMGESLWSSGLMGVRWGGDPVSSLWSSGLMGVSTSLWSSRLMGVRWVECKQPLKPKPQGQRGQSS